MKKRALLINDKKDECFISYETKDMYFKVSYNFFISGYDPANSLTKKLKNIEELEDWFQFFLKSEQEQGFVLKEIKEN